MYIKISEGKICEDLTDELILLDNDNIRKN